MNPSTVDRKSPGRTRKYKALPKSSPGQRVSVGLSSEAKLAMEIVKCEQEARRLVAGNLLILPEKRIGSCGDPTPNQIHTGELNITERGEKSGVQEWEIYIPQGRAKNVGGEKNTNIRDRYKVYNSNSLQSRQKSVLSLDRKVGTSAFGFGRQVSGLSLGRQAFGLSLNRKSGLCFGSRQTSMLNVGNPYQRMNTICHRAIGDSHDVRSRGTTNSVTGSASTRKTSYKNQKKTLPTSSFPDSGSVCEHSSDNPSSAKPTNGEIQLTKSKKKHKNRHANRNECTEETEHSGENDEVASLPHNLAPSFDESKSKQSFSEAYDKLGCFYLEGDITKCEVTQKNKWALDGSVHPENALEIVEIVNSATWKLHEEEDDSASKEDRLRLNSIYKCSVWLDSHLG